MEKIDKNGKRISAKNVADNKTPPKSLLPRWINNILVIISTVVSTLLALLVLVLLTKHCGVPYTLSPSSNMGPGWFVLLRMSLRL